jgi:ABC-type multidrug transport system permease subunit
MAMTVFLQKYIEESSQQVKQDPLAAVCGPLIQMFCRCVWYNRHVVGHMWLLTLHLNVIKLLVPQLHKLHLKCWRTTHDWQVLHWNNTDMGYFYMIYFFHQESLTKLLEDFMLIWMSLVFIELITQNIRTV